MKTLRKERTNHCKGPFSQRIWKKFPHCYFLSGQESCEIHIVSFISLTEKKFHSQTMADDLYFVLLYSRTSTLFTKPLCVCWFLWMVHKSFIVQSTDGDIINHHNGSLPLLLNVILHYVCLSSWIFFFLLSYNLRSHYKWVRRIV